MKKTANNVWGKALLLCSILVWGAGAYAQDNASTLPESAYQYQPTTTKSLGGILGGHLPIVIFGVLFVLMVVTAYHYWANGKLVDDMSSDPTINRD